MAALSYPQVLSLDTLRMYYIQFPVKGKNCVESRGQNPAYLLWQVNPLDQCLTQTP